MSKLYVYFLKTALIKSQDSCQLWITAGLIISSSGHQMAPCSQPFLHDTDSQAIVSEILSQNDNNQDAMINFDEFVPWYATDNTCAWGEWKVFRY